MKICNLSKGFKQKRDKRLTIKLRSCNLFSRDFNQTHSWTMVTFSIKCLQYCKLLKLPNLPCLLLTLNFLRTFRPLLWFLLSILQWLLISRFLSKTSFLIWFLRPIFHLSNLSSCLICSNLCNLNSSFLPRFNNTSHSHNNNKLHNKNHNNKSKGHNRTHLKLNWKRYKTSLLKRLLMETRTSMACWPNLQN